jgi:cell division protein FtsB
MYDLLCWVFDTDYAHRYEELAKKFSERDDAIEKIQTRRAALEAQVSALKEEKKVN